MLTLGVQSFGEVYVHWVSSASASSSTGLSRSSWASARGESWASAAYKIFLMALVICKEDSQSIALFKIMIVCV